MSAQTLDQAIILAGKDGNDISRGLSQLVGCPVGGWPQTEQAWRQLEDMLPGHWARAYSAAELVDATLQEVAGARYGWRRSAG